MKNILIGAVFALLIVACQQVVYVPNACLVFKKIKISDQDYLVMEKMSQDFKLGVKHYNEFIDTCPSD